MTSVTFVSAYLEVYEETIDSILKTSDKYFENFSQLDSSGISIPQSFTNH